MNIIADASLHGPVAPPPPVCPYNTSGQGEEYPLGVLSRTSAGVDFTRTSRPAPTFIRNAIPEAIRGWKHLCEFGSDVGYMPVPQSADVTHRQ